jgi:hypothetical protein
MSNTVFGYTKVLLEEENLYARPCSCLLGHLEDQE